MASLRFEMNGEWDLGDLGHLTGSLKLTYAYFYWISVAPERMPAQLKTLFARYFWSGQYIGDRFAEQLYWEIPNHDRVRLKSIEYHSPGWMEIAGAAGALTSIAVAVRTWADAFEKVLDLMTRIGKFFDDRKLRSIPNKLSLDKIGGRTVDDARRLCFEIGRLLGFEQARIEEMIELTGNPISTLRLLVSLANEARRIDDLAKAKKLTLPPK